MPTMKDEGCDLRAAQEKDPQFGPLIDALEDRLEEDLPQIQKQALRAEVLKYTLHGSQNVLCKVTTSDRTSSTIKELFFSHVVGRPAAREEVDETDTGLVVVTIRWSQSNAVVLSHASISANIRAVV
jgi:hypothetical protein